MKPNLRCLLFGLVASAGSATAGPWDFSDGPPASLPALNRYEAPVFPQRLRPTTVTAGYATMIFTVKSDGSIDDALALEASDPAFVETTISALQHWRLAAAQSNTMPRREVIQFDYRRTGTVASLTQSDASKAAFIGSQALAPLIRTMPWEAVDDEPQRISGAMPTYPQSLRTSPVRGHATIDFVIDAEGRVRVPTVLDASAPEFGKAALTAVRQWRFEPSVQDGAPVNVHVRRSFTFGNALAKRLEPAENERIAQTP